MPSDGSYVIFINFDSSRLCFRTVVVFPLKCLPETSALFYSATDNLIRKISFAA